MSEAKSSVFTNPHPTLTECGKCLKEMVMVYWGQKRPTHDPVTGDMICWECKLKHQSTHPQPESSHATLRHPEPLPLCLKLEMDRQQGPDTANLQDGMGDACQHCVLALDILKKPGTDACVSVAYCVPCENFLCQEHALHHDKEHLLVHNTHRLNVVCGFEAMHDKCDNHVGKDWIVVDLDGLHCLCLPCSKEPLYCNRNRALIEEAAPIIRSRLATALTSPLESKSDSLLEANNQSESKSVSDDQDRCGVGIIEVAHRMSKVAEALHRWRKHVEGSHQKICTRLSDLRSILTEGGPLRRLEMTLHSADSFYQSAASVHISHLRPMIRIREVISKSLLVCSKLLGLGGNEGETLLSKSAVLEILSKRKVEARRVGEEVMVLKSVTSLRDTLKTISDPLLLDLIKEDVEGILNQQGGLVEALEALKSKVKNEVYDSFDGVTQGKLEELLSEAKGIGDEAMKAGQLLSRIHEQDYWKVGLAEWKKVRLQTTIQVCLDALLYEDNEPRQLTYRSLKVLQDAKMIIGEANALFIEGIRLYYHQSRLSAFKCFSEGAKRGCVHPLLYYFMGECYRYSGQSSNTEGAKALEYYEKAIQGSCTWGHIGTYSVYCYDCGEVKEDKAKAFDYLLDLDNEGKPDGRVLFAIGTHYEKHKYNTDLQFKYYERAKELGYTPAYRELHSMLRKGGFRYSAEKDKAMLILLESEKKGIGEKDDRLLSALIDCYLEDLYIPSAEVLGTFNNIDEMVLHYAEVLVKRGSPLGYYKKGAIYTRNYFNVRADWSKAVSTWEMADQLGLADYDTYIKGLVDAYKSGCNVARDGKKVLEFCEKALRLTSGETSVINVIDKIAEVYKVGISPVAQDGNEVIKCYERGCQLAPSVDGLSHFYQRMAEVYEKGVSPLTMDGTKALEYYERAIRLSPYNRKRMDLCIKLAKIYKVGVPPVNKDGNKMIESYERALQFADATHDKAFLYRKMAEACEQGIPPITKGLEKAKVFRKKIAELWESE